MSLEQKVRLLSDRQLRRDIRLSREKRSPLMSAAKDNERHDMIFELAIRELCRRKLGLEELPKEPVRKQASLTNDNDYYIMKAPGGKCITMPGSGPSIRLPGFQYFLNKRTATAGVM